MHRFSFEFKYLINLGWDPLKVEYIPNFVNKRNRGRVQTYIRRKEESLWEISQIFGIKLKKLKKFNEGNLSDKIILRKGIF